VQDALATWKREAAVTTGSGSWRVVPRLHTAYAAAEKATWEKPC
jgi:hypothetical protein